MIHATDARKLVENSEKVLNQYLEKISAAIEEAAEKGDCALNLSARFSERSAFVVNKPTYHAAKMTDLQEKLAIELRNNGYRVEIDSQVHNGPRMGMFDEYETPENHTTYSIMVKW